MSTNKSGPPDVNVSDLYEIFLRAEKEMLACDEDNNWIFENSFKSLCTYMTHENVKTSMNAFFFIMKLVDSTEKGSSRYFQLFTLLIRKCGSSSNSGPVLDGILKKLSQHFIEATQHETLPDDQLISCFSAIEENLTEFITHFNPNSGFHFLNHFHSLEPNILKKLYGNLLLKILFEEINFTKCQYLEFWDVLCKDESLLFSLFIWIKESDYQKLIHVYSLFPEKELLKDFSALFLANLFVRICLEGIDNVQIYQKVRTNVVKADESVQSVVCVLLAIHLKNCPPSLATRYLQLCTDLIKKQGVCKQAAQLLRVQLIFFSRDAVFFPEIKNAIVLLKDTIENNVGNLSDVANPVLSDLSLRFIIKRYPSLNEAIEILRLLHVFHSNPSSVRPWLELYASLGHMKPKLERDSDDEFFFFPKSGKPKIEEEKLMSVAINETCIAVLNFIAFYDENSNFALDVLLKTDKKDLCAAWSRFFIEENPSVQNSLLTRIASTKDHKGGDVFRMKLFEDIKSNPLNNQVGLVENVYMRLKSHEKIKIKEQISMENSKEYVIGYLMMLDQAMRMNCMVDSEKFLFEINAILNRWLHDPSGAFVISVVIDCLTSFCDQNLLILIAIWGEIVRLAIAINEDCVFKSISRFLSLVPDVVYLRSFRVHHYALIPKSVNVLWKLIVCDTSASKHAVDSLSRFNLENFDRTLLSCCDEVSLDPTSEDYESINGAIPECCWLHLLLEIRKEHCITLFTKLIEKGTANTPQHENYSSLQRALVIYLKEATDDEFEYFDPENEPLTDICLTLLSIKWERSDLDFSFLFGFFSKCSSYIHLQNKVLLILILNSETYSAKEAFNKLIDNDFIKPHHTKMLYLLEGKQKKDTWFSIFKHTGSLIMKDRISQGLSEAFKDGHTIEESKILFILRNPQVSFCVKHSIICILLKIWEKSSKGEQFELSCAILARCDIEFIRSIPSDKMDTKTYKKYIEVLTLRAVQSKLLMDFDECLVIASKIPSLKCFVLLNLVKVLKCLGSVKLSQNKIWLTQYILQIDKNINNFNAAVVALCLDALTGTMLLSSELNFYSAVDHIPISLASFFKSKESSVLKIVSSWKDDQKLNPIFSEAFRATTIIFCDAIPAVSYNSYVKIQN